MARYKATAGNASRLGHAAVGISGGVDGWRTGVKVSAHGDAKIGADGTVVTRAGGLIATEDTDRFFVEIDGGSGHAGRPKTIATIRETLSEHGAFTRTLTLYAPDTGEAVGEYTLA